MNSAEIQDRYQKDGFVFPLDILSASETKELRDDLESAESQLSDDSERLGLLRAYPDRLLPSFDKVIRHPNLLKAAMAVLGPDLMVWSGSTFIKEANTSHIVSWHQDLTYWGLDTDEETTLWLALSPANRNSGAMKFIPGSHKTSIVDHHDTFDDNNLLSRGQEIAVDVNEEDAVVTELAPGQASMHHGHLFHASDPNTTDDVVVDLASTAVVLRIRS